MSYIDTKYFFYKGKSYTTNTVVKLTKQYTDTHMNNGLPIWKYAMFSHKLMNSDEYFFQFVNSFYPNIERVRMGTYCGYFLINGKDLEGAIEEIIRPIPIELVPVVPKKDYEVEGMGILWLIYIAVLFFSLIFREFYIIWIVASFVFFKIRKEMLNQ